MAVKYRWGKRGYRQVRKRKKWDKETRQTHDKLDIDKYLAEEARRLIVTQEVIDQYKEMRKTRDTPRAGRYTRWTDYSHGSNPWCKICGEDLVVGDDVFLFYVSGTIMYHVEHFKNERESKQKNIIYQDRAFLRRHGG